MDRLLSITEPDSEFSYAYKECMFCWNVCNIVSMLITDWFWAKI